MQPPRHLALVLLTGLGDVIHGLPVVNALRRHWPDTRITWIGYDSPTAVDEALSAWESVTAT